MARKTKYADDGNWTFGEQDSRFTDDPWDTFENRKHPEVKGIVRPKPGSLERIEMMMIVGIGRYYHGAGDTFLGALDSCVKRMNEEAATIRDMNKLMKQNGADITVPSETVAEFVIEPPCHVPEGWTPNPVPMAKCDGNHAEAVPCLDPGCWLKTQTHLQLNPKTEGGAV